VQINIARCEPQFADAKVGASYTPCCCSTQSASRLVGRHGSAVRQWCAGRMRGCCAHAAASPAFLPGLRYRCSLDQYTSVLATSMKRFCSPPAVPPRTAEQDIPCIFPCEPPA
jgi:hypothetical protein